MYRVGSLPRTHSIKLAVGGVCLLFLISVVEGPGGWLKSFCLSPLVLTACTLNGWSLALLGVLAFILSEIFSYVRWVPEPVAVLLLLSFLFFFRGSSFVRIFVIKKRNSRGREIVDKTGGRFSKTTLPGFSPQIMKEE